MLILQGQLNSSDPNGIDIFIRLDYYTKNDVKLKIFMKYVCMPAMKHFDSFTMTQ